MGVTGLWTVVQPCARPIKLETLNKKRLAVDASIWIYQFLKAVRDKEGNALRNSHVVGFFRRICKLLFVGIKPVFVFDGGAPALKRQTISNRKRRREGRREDAVRTAGKLLAVQMQRKAEEDAQKRRQERERPAYEDDEEEKAPENPVYVDELLMSNQERVRNRTFKKTDAYHLPALDVALENMGGMNDPRIMSREELEDYARQFHTGEEINLYDFSKIDFNSPFFLSLPASDRYNILNAARLRSRLRMGYSKDQLDNMFQDRMAFSRFQIERVKERNELTQRLMNLNGMNGDDGLFIGNGVGRVVGEKGKEYVLVKNDGVEGGWALGVVGTKNDEGAASKPINVETMNEKAVIENEESSDEGEEFEDVPIEGLNQLPKIKGRKNNNSKESNFEARKTALYKSRSKLAKPTSSAVGQAAEQEVDSLFVQDDLDMDRDSNASEGSRHSLFSNSDDELDRAIALSLEDNTTESKVHDEQQLSQEKASQAKPFAKGSGRSIAQAANARSNVAAPAPFIPEDEEEDYMTFEAALVASRRAKHSKEMKAIAEPPVPSKSIGAQETGIFGGPLPFERLDFSKSLFSKKKEKSPEAAGGFEKEGDVEKPKVQRPPKPKPLPPWFSSNVVDDSKAQKDIEERQFDEGADKEAERSASRRIVAHQDTNELIEVHSSDEEDHEIKSKKASEIIDLVDDGEKPDAFEIQTPPIPLEGSEKISDAAKPPSVSPKPDFSDDIEMATFLQTDDAQITSPSPSEKAQSPPVLDEHKSPSPEFEDVLPPPGSNSETNAPISSPAPVPVRSPIADDFDQQPFDESGDEFSDPEDADLFQQLAAEADEHARFAAELTHKSSVQTAADYERELKSLRNQQKKDRRDADEVSHIMISECQQLLKLFGLPYITAPMEAEAQCAELVRLNLVDGIVTDDSDIFLFGGTRVYKNMFNQAKFVECYLMADLEKEFALDRHRLIRIAHLLGSDYTEGIPTVGPVTALEIVSEFEDLAAFREWWDSVQSSNLNARQAAKEEPTPFRRKFRKNAARIFLPPVFPDTRVDEAYIRPEVDSDQSPFAWGVPDLDALRDYLMATIGWSQERTDEVLVPVIRDINKREKEGTQSNITNFFAGGVGVGAAPSMAGKSKKKADSDADVGVFAPRQRNLGKSKRLEGALGKLKAQAKRRREEEEEDDQSSSHSDARMSEESGGDYAPKKKSKKSTKK